MNKFLKISIYLLSIGSIYTIETLLASSTYELMEKEHRQKPTASTAREISNKITDEKLAQIQDDLEAFFPVKKNHWLNNSDIFILIGATNRNEPYGWLKVFEGRSFDGSKNRINRTDLVLAVRTNDGDGIEFITDDPNKKGALITLPYGLWHWRYPRDPEFGAVRMNPDGVAFRWDNARKQWINGKTKKPFVPSNNPYPNPSTSASILRSAY